MGKHNNSLPKERPIVEETAVEEIVENKEIIKEVTPELATVTDCVCLNVRKEPSVESDVVGILNNGELVEIESVNNEWFKVNKENRLKGYSMKKYLMKTK